MSKIQIKRIDVFSVPTKVKQTRQNITHTLFFSFRKEFVMADKFSVEQAQPE
jgi:hypothetical protein